MARACSVILVGGSSAWFCYEGEKITTVETEKTKLHPLQGPLEESNQCGFTSWNASPAKNS
jgi:aerobic-type carbon monoxide dehydrogenase small subunit (CoxS/CutS family)